MVNLIVAPAQLPQQLNEPKRPPLKITFGVELEFSFMVQRAHFYEWLGEPDPRIASRQRKAQRYGPTQFLGPVIPTISEELLHVAGSETTTTLSSLVSTDAELQEKLRKYFIKLLNHELRKSPKTPSLLGEIIDTESKKGPSDQWHLTHDMSVRPHRIELATQTAQSIEEANRNWWPGGAELVTAILEFDDEVDWFPKFAQIRQDFMIDKMQHIWFNQQEGLHVHIGKTGGEFSVATLQNVVALYGLYENEIEQWIAMEDRDDSQLCMRMRRAMENYHYSKDGEGKILPVPTRKYTPQGFTERVYGVPQDATPLQFKLAVCGKEAIDEDETNAEMGRFSWTTVNIHLPRENKTNLTIEFRHHEGTVDPFQIKWWVTFLAYLVRYAHLLSVTGHKILDDKKNSSPGNSFVGQLAERTSILDLIAFPEEGKKYFAEKKSQLYDEGFNARRSLEDKLIRERSRRRMENNETTGVAMDADIRKEQWFIEEHKELETKY